MPFTDPGREPDAPSSLLARLKRRKPFQRAFVARRAQAGDTDGAIADLQRLLTGPSYLSAHHLRLDPIRGPTRDDPRFQALLVRGGAR
jgi:hypothetical protein